MWFPIMQLVQQRGTVGFHGQGLKPGQDEKEFSVFVYLLMDIYVDYIHGICECIFVHVHALWSLCGLF